MSSERGQGAAVPRAAVLPTGPAPATPRAHIAVVAPLGLQDMTEDMGPLACELISVTLRTLWELDATFELLDPSSDLGSATLPDGCDGLLLLGGGDIDPSCYTRLDTQTSGIYGVDPRSDQQSLALIAQAERDGLPILGICRGHQLLNVYRGGTLIADIDDPTHIHHGAPDEPLFCTETVDVCPDTRLWSIFNERQLDVWTAHHQAIDILGEGLVVCARASDDSIEAIEDPTRWFVGVQWHPERAGACAEDRRKLFGALISACG